jgi:hypothetical protein
LISNFPGETHNERQKNHKVIKKGVGSDWEKKKKLEKGNICDKTA